MKNDLAHPSTIERTGIDWKAFIIVIVMIFSIISVIVMIFMILIMMMLQGSVNLI